MALASRDTSQPIERNSWLHAHFLLLGLQLICFFIVLLLVIVNADQPKETTSSPMAIFITRRSLFVYETLIAGLLGAYLSEILGISTGQTLSERGGRLAAVLFLGGAAAIVVGVLFPLVVLGQFEGPNINSWTLVVAGGIAGNRARSALSQVEDVIAHLLVSLEPKVDTAVIVDSVKAGMQQAFAGPEPVRYQGFVSMSIVRFGESILKPGEAGEDRATLHVDEKLEVRVQFAPSEADLGWASTRVTRPIKVSRGDETAPTVPFRLLVDFGFPGLAPVEREITVPRDAKSQIESFAFTVPAPDFTAAAAESVSANTAQIAVSVYQHTRYFDSCVVLASVSEP